MEKIFIGIGASEIALLGCFMDCEAINVELLKYFPIGIAFVIIGGIISYIKEIRK